MAEAFLGSFDVAAVAGKGKGLVASKAFQRGDVFLCEEPMLIAAGPQQCQQCLRFSADAAQHFVCSPACGAKSNPHELRLLRVFSPAALSSKEAVLAVKVVASLAYGGQEGKESATGTATAPASVTTSQQRLLAMENHFSDLRGQQWFREQMLALGVPLVMNE